MRAKNSLDKYRKDRKNNKCNKILYRLRKRRNQEGPRNVRKYRKVTRIFLASWKHPWQISLVTFGNPCLKNYGYCTATFMYNARILWPVFFSPQFAILDILEGSLWWVLSHEKFCYHPLLLLKICPLLWATLLSMHCSCMLMEERSIHRLILQYFATVSNYKWCHVCNWWFHFRENGTHYKTGQQRIPVEITISIRQKQWCAGVLGSFLARQQ